VRSFARWPARIVSFDVGHGAGRHNGGGRGIVRADMVTRKINGHRPLDRVAVAQCIALAWTELPEVRAVLKECSSSRNSGRDSHAASRHRQMRASARLSEQDVLLQLDAATVARLLKRPMPGETDEMMAWLADEHAIEIDGDGIYITNFGAVAAAKDLTRFEGLDRERIRVIQYRGVNKVVTIDEQRAETSVYPDIALRELIANALIHQDFSVTGTGPTIIPDLYFQVRCRTALLVRLRNHGMNCSQAHSYVIGCARSGVLGLRKSYPRQSCSVCPLCRLFRPRTLFRLSSTRPGSWRRCLSPNASKPATNTRFSNMSRAAP
jgi:hypothetical protein